MAMADDTKSEQLLPDPGAILRWLDREEQIYSERVHAIQNDLDKIRADVGDSRTSEEARNSLLKDSQKLNEQRDLTQLKLNDIREQQQSRQSQQLWTAFGAECDLVLDGGQSLTLQGAHLKNVVNVAGRKMLQFEVKDTGLCTVDPSRIVYAIIRKPAEGKPAEAPPAKRQ